jgi:hypothetical protein
MPTIRYDTSHPAGATPEQRIANRLKTSGDVKHADVSTSHGTGPTRTNTHIFHAANHVPVRGVPDFGSEMPGHVSKKDQGK